MATLRKAAFLAALFTGAALSAKAGAAEMSFENVCAGNSAATCFALASGQIVAGTPDAFRAYLEKEHSDGNKVLFDSPGGSLSAGLKLGRMIREAGFETQIGKWEQDGTFGEAKPGGNCLSACAYAFLGGTVRRVAEGNTLGFHQFSLASSAKAAESAGVDLAAALTTAQRISSQLVAYLLEMGADARIFALGTEAESDDMFVPDRQALEEYDLVTPEGFGEFYLEPYQDGVVAASRRKAPTRLYDIITQLTAYCRAGRPFMLVSADSTLPAQNLPGAVLVVDDATRIDIDADRVRARGDSAAELALEDAQAQSLINARNLAFSMFLGQSDGGELRAEIPLSAMDRKVLAASYRFCIKN